MIARPLLVPGLALAAAGLLAACTGTARATASGGKDPQYASPSPASGDVVDKARTDAEKTGEKIKEEAQDVKREAKPVVKEVEAKTKEGAHETAEVLDATKQHLDVKAALLADKTVDASHIEIDTDKDAKILYLRGTVPTSAQKAAAERIAKDKADGFTVKNQLTVAAAPKR